jgi:hypothetical protein
VCQHSRTASGSPGYRRSPDIPPTCPIAMSNARMPCAQSLPKWSGLSPRCSPRVSLNLPSQMNAGWPFPSHSTGLDHWKTCPTLFLLASLLLLIAAVIRRFHEPRDMKPKNRSSRSSFRTMSVPLAPPLRMGLVQHRTRAVLCSVRQSHPRCPSVQDSATIDLLRSPHLQCHSKGQS